MRFLKKLARRAWAVVTRQRFERGDQGSDRLRARILGYSEEIAEALKVTSDTFQIQNYRDSAMHRIIWCARQIAKQV
jgi:hypothetical protein